MIKFNRASMAMLLGAFGLLAVTAALAGDTAESMKHRDLSKMELSGTVTFEITSVKLIVGASWGKGTLIHGGKSYPVEVKAATAGGIGYRSIRGYGDVYNLKRLEDFAGIYSGGTAGATMGEKGGGSSLIENGKEVIIQAKITDSKGAQLALSAGGVQIKFAE